MGQEFPPTCVQAQHVIQLHCQTRTRPALAHKVGEKPPRSPWPTSQPETTATHHGFARPLATANKLETNRPRHAVTICLLHMHLGIQTHPEPIYYIFSWETETNDMVTSLSTISIHTFWHTASRAQKCRCWLKAVCKKTPQKLRMNSVDPHDMFILRLSISKLIKSIRLAIADLIPRPFRRHSLRQSLRHTWRL